MKRKNKGNVGQTKVTRIINNVPIERRKGFIFSKRDDYTDREHLLMDNCLDLFKNDVMLDYSSYVNTFKFASDSDMTSNTIIANNTPSSFNDQFIRDVKAKTDQMFNDLINNLKRIYNTYGENISWRVRTPNHTFYFNIVYIIKEEDKRDITFTIAVNDYDDSNMIATFNFLHVSRHNGESNISSVLNGPVFIGKREHDVENLIHSATSQQLISSYGDIISILYNGSTVMLNNGISQEEIMKTKPEYVHSKCEMFVINKFIREVINNENRDYIILALSAWISPEINVNEPRTISGPFNILRDDYKNYPLIDFTEKEFKYCYNYLKRNKILVKDSDEFNLKKYLAAPKLGTNAMRFNVYDADVDEERVYLLTWELDDDNDQCTFYMSTRINVNLVIYAHVKVNNISHVLTHRDVEELLVDAIHHNFDELYSSITDITKQIPDLLTDRFDIMNALLSMISVIIVIEDRPERSRVISYKEKTRSHTYESKNKEKSEFAIRRILKPIKEAKEFIREVSTNSEYSDREYTMESWERSGHYRHLKNGKSIWIGETTCHRKLPLTEKEIHIKL